MEELKKRIERRHPCFTQCNATDEECYKSAKDKCSGFEHCLFIAPILNKGYNPNEPQVEGKNEPTFDYGNADDKKKMQIEMYIEKNYKPVEAKTEEKVERKRKEPVAEKPVEKKKRGRPKTKDISEIDDELSGLDDAGEEASSLKEATGEESDGAVDDLGDLLDNTEAETDEKEQEKELLPDMDEPNEEAAEETPVNDLSESPNIKTEILKSAPAGLDLSAYKELIDYAVEKIKEVIGSGKKERKERKPKNQEPELDDIDSEKEEEKPKKRRGRKPGKKAEKKPVKKAKRARKKS